MRLTDCDVFLNECMFNAIAAGVAVTVLLIGAVSLCALMLRGVWKMSKED